MLNEIDELSMQAYIYTMDGCKYCTWAKHLLDQHGISYTENNIHHGGWNDFHRSFGPNTTLPQIFLAEVPAGQPVPDNAWKYIGGYDDLKQYLR